MLGRRTLGNALRSYHGQDAALYEMFFQGRRNGTYVEMTAGDGVAASNTFAFEHALDWSGVLIEPNPISCAALRRNRPRSHCLCTAVSHDYGVVEYRTDAEEELRKYRNGGGKVRVPSAPLGFLLRTAGIDAIDLFSLRADDGGSALHALLSFDWSVPVRVWNIASPPGSADEGRLVDLLAFHGYRQTLWPHHAGAANFDKLFYLPSGAEKLWPDEQHGEWPPPNARWRPWVAPSSWNKDAPAAAPPSDCSAAAADAAADAATAVAAAAKEDRKVQQLAARFRAAGETAAAQRERHGTESEDATDESKVERLAARFRAAGALAARERRGPERVKGPKEHVRTARPDEEVEPDWMAAARAYDVANRREVVVSNRTATTDWMAVLAAAAPPSAAAPAAALVFQWRPRVREL